MSNTNGLYASMNQCSDFSDLVVGDFGTSFNLSTRARSYPGSRISDGIVLFRSAVL